LVKLCREADMGFIAMKGLSGGLLNNAAACHAFMDQHENVVPIWGVQREEELDQWLELAKSGVTMTPELRSVIEKDRQELAGSFCRGCGYCMPCPAGIEINNSARMNMLLRRAPYKPYLSDEWREKMHRIENCIHCDSCKSRCPYGLDTPALLQYMLKDYDEFYAQHHND
ncbi:MAG: 4Fe-4S dicluster domain-containing protein, partial [Oscillibacter sp.]|nr:4Fe-4S dicluster domain-containing protein [Oscillibacter sp.]